MSVALLTAATASRRSRSVGYGFNGGNINRVILTVTGTLGAGSGSIDVSTDGGQTWAATGAVLDADTPSQQVTIGPGMQVSVDYTASSSTWTLTAT